MSGIRMLESEWSNKGESDYETDGMVIAIRGDVVDVRFRTEPSGINEMLKVGSNGALRVEVNSLLNSQTVRAIALAPTTGLELGAVVRGMRVVTALN